MEDEKDQEQPQEEVKLELPKFIEPTTDKEREDQIQNLLDLQKQSYDGNKDLDLKKIQKLIHKYRQKKFGRRIGGSKPTLKSRAEKYKTIKKRQRAARKKNR